MSTRSARLFAARARARRWAVARPAFVVTLAASLIAAIAWVVLGSGAVDVRHVEIAGTTKLSAADVRRTAQPFIGNPMVIVDTSALRARVAAIPSVASVTVTRAWPNTLQVTVRERTAMVATSRADGWLLIDRNGVPFTTVASLPKGVLPLTVRMPSATDPSTHAALAVLASLPSAVRHRVTAVLAPTPAGVQLRLTQHVTVVWGGPEDSPRKAHALAALLHRRAAVYDVSTPGFVTTS